MTDEQIDALVQGARVELIELSTANNDRLDQELRACLKGGAIKDGEVVGTFSAFMDLRRTNVAGLYAEAIVERVGGAARISGLYLGPDVESLRASGVAKMRDSVQTDAERKRELARALDDNERRAIARNRADEVQQAEARVQAKLSPAEEERLATLTKAAGEADKNYQWAARNSTDWRKLKEAIYSAAGTSGLEVEEAARVHYMGQAAWDEWRALLSRRSVAAGR